MKIVAFQVEIGGIRGVVNDLNSVKAAIRATNDELGNATRGTAEYQRLQRQLGGLKQIQSEIRAETRNQQREFVQAADRGRRSYRALNAELVNLKNQFRELSEEERRSGVGRNLVRQIQALDGELKKIDASIGQYQRNVGNYRQALLGVGDLVTGGLLTGGLIAVGQAVQRSFADGLNTFREFQQQIAELQGVSQSTAEEIARLEELAKRLGETTQFTATQVAELETIFARSGFGVEQIEAATAASLDFAIATRSSLEDTANVVTGVISGLGLAADETDRVANVLVDSFNSTKQSREAFANSLQFVIGTARAANVEIEELAAAQGVLADANFSGSTQGTALRRILSDLSTESSKLSRAVGFSIESSEDLTRAFKVLAEQGVDNERAFELVGRTSQAALVTLVQNADRVEELAGQFDRSSESVEAFSKTGESLGEFAGVAAATAAVVGDTLEQDLLKARSAVEGLQIELFETSQGGLRAIVQGFTSFVSLITENLTPALSFLSRVFAPVGEAAGRLFEALGFGREQAQGLGEVLSDFLINAIVFLANSIEGLINNVTFVVNAFRSYVALLDDATGIVTRFANGFRVLVALFQATPNILNGLSEAVQNIFQNLSVGFQRTVLNARIAINDIRGLVSSASRDAAQELRNQRDNLEGSGRSIGQAFRDGFNESATIRNQVLTDALKEDAEQATGELTETIRENTEDIPDILGGNIEAGAERAKNAFESLTAQQNELATAIKVAITEGRDYADLLEQYNEVTQQITNVNEEFKDSINEIALAAEFADASVKGLSAVVSELKQELQTAQPDQVQAITEELIEAEERLQEAQNEILRARDIASGGTGLIEADIQDELDLIESIRLLRESQAQQQIQDQQELQDALSAIRLQSEIDSIEARLRIQEDGTDEFLRLETELAQKRAELGTLDSDTGLRQRLNAIELERLARLAALDEVGLGEEALAARRRQIELEAQRDVLAAKLTQEQLSNIQREQLAQDLADKEIEINRAKNDEIVRQDQERLQTVSSALEFAGSNILGLAEALNEVQEQATDRQIEQIEQRYDREIELAGDNRDRVAQLERDRDAETEQVQRRAFERQKRLQIAQALVSGAQAIVSTLAAVPGPADILSLGTFRALQIAFTAATTVAQVAAISRQSFAEGGYTGSGIAPPDSTGHRPAGIVHANEFVINRKALATQRGRQLAAEADMLNKGIHPGSGMAGAIQPYIPADRSTNVNVKSSLSMSHTQVASIAEAVATKTAAAVIEGMIKGSIEAGIEQERRNRLKSKVG